MKSFSYFVKLEMHFLLIVFESLSVILHVYLIVCVKKTLAERCASQSLAVAPEYEEFYYEVPVSNPMLLLIRESKFIVCTDFIHSSSFHLQE